MPRATTDFASVMLWVMLACLAHVAVYMLVLVYGRRSRLSRGRADAALDYADMAVPVPYPVAALVASGAGLLHALHPLASLPHTNPWTLTETLTLNPRPSWIPGRRSKLGAPPPPLRAAPLRAAPPPSEPPDSRGCGAGTPHVSSLPLTLPLVP
jgi:hypothetical protein